MLAGLVAGWLVSGAPVRAAPVDTADMETVSIVSEDFAGPLRWMAEDLAAVLNGTDVLRMLPIFGVGGNGTGTEILYLKSIDLALVHSDLLAYAERNGLHKDLGDRVRYISRLYDKEVAVIAADTIRDIRQLAGKKVNFDTASSSSFSTSVLIFELLGIKVESVQYSQPIALEKIKSGEIAATILIDDKPNKLIATLVAGHGLQLVPVRPTRALRDIYQPTTFTSEDYPNLIPAGQTVDSIGVSVVMAMYNWPPNAARYGRVALFVDQFFSRLSELRSSGHHPNWQKVDLAAALPGWTRFKPATDWLARQEADPTVPGDGAMATLREMFQKFIELQAEGSGQDITEEEKTALFRLFLGWKENPDEANIKLHLTALENTGRAIGVISAKNIEVSVSGDSQIGLLLEPKLTGLPPGSHALQVHANPNCSAGEQDGTLVVGLGAGSPLQLIRQSTDDDGEGAGLATLDVAEDGTAGNRIILPGLSLANLLDRSIVISNGGSASDRIACGIID